jgi:hypothetical protein
MKMPRLIDNEAQVMLEDIESAASIAAIKHLPVLSALLYALIGLLISKPTPVRELELLASIAVKSLQKVVEEQENIKES